MSRSESRHWTVGTITARLFFAVVALGIVLLPLSPLASSKAFAHAGAASSLPAASAPSGHVTVIALDMSGSMGGNDPNGLRCSAANAYVDLSGPGDFVGVVGLDNNGPTGGQHNFPLAQIWAQPVELATVAARQQLRATIAAKSHNCRPDAATPTYDALQQSLDMLVKTTAQTHLPGSVILLTDGVPAPQQNEQISAIQKDLIPQFKQHDFPIDTVALGADGTLRSFLSDLANATGGSYYDDGHGVVSGISPLNIAPFFVELFAQRNGRTVTHDIPPTALSGGTVSRNFAIGNFVSHLDVVAVKDSPGTRVTLTAPNGQVLPPAVAGTFISSDPHYVIFSVDHPQSGAWQLNVTGTGRFLMDSLKLSTLGLSILAPASDVPLPLGQPLTISATLNDNGTPITGSRYSMNGTINYTGGGTSGYTQEFVLDDHANPGTYSAQITVPASAPAGAYNVTINAREVSDTIASANRSVRIELFPSPLLVAPATGKPTTATVNTTVTQWDPALRALYGVPFGLVTWLSQWPLQGHPVVEGARLHGTVQLAGLPYANATVSGSATRAGTKAAIPLNISSGDGGRFTAAFTPSGDGPYTLTFRTQGSFKDSHGDLGTTTRAVALRTQPASLAQEAIAWMITLLYLFLLVLIVVLARYLLSQKPFGRLVANDGGGGEEFARARRGVYGLLHPGTVLSQQMGLDPGLAFRFQRGNRITVEGLGSGRKSYRLAGEPVPTSAVSAAESLLTTNEGLSYTVSASGSDEFLDEDEGTRRGGLLRRGTASDGYDDDDYSGGRRGLFGRTSRNDDFDEYDPRSSGRRSRRSRDDYDDDDDRASRSRRGSREDALDDDYSSGSRSRKSRRRDDDDY